MATQIEQALELARAYQKKVEAIREEGRQPRPLVTGPVVGWRALTIRNGQLTSPAADGYVWEPGIATAHCIGSLSGACRKSLDGRCPGERCMCGFFAFESRADHLRSDFFRDDKATVTFELELTGKVLVTQEMYGPGWHAEQARILRLVIYDAAQQEDAERIASAHNVPLEHSSFPHERPTVPFDNDQRVRLETMKLQADLMRLKLARQQQKTRMIAGLASAIDRFKQDEEMRRFDTERRPRRLLEHRPPLRLLLHRGRHPLSLPTLAKPPWPPHPNSAQHRGRRPDCLLDAPADRSGRLAAHRARRPVPSARVRAAPRLRTLRPPQWRRRAPLLARHP